MTSLETLKSYAALGYVVGPYSLSRGDHRMRVPKLGSGRRITAFTPMPTYPVGMFDNERAYDENLRDTPLLHSTQQMEAVRYAEKSIGFGNETVTFRVEWLWFEPGDITVNVGSSSGFIQEQTGSRVK